MKDWMLQHNLASEDQLAGMEAEVTDTVAKRQGKCLGDIPAGYPEGKNRVAEDHKK